MDKKNIKEEINQLALEQKELKVKVKKYQRLYNDNVVTHSELWDLLLQKYRNRILLRHLYVLYNELRGIPYESTEVNPKTPYDKIKITHLKKEYELK